METKKEEYYDAFVILDFEAVWNDVANPVPEIIEFPSVILNLKTMSKYFWADLF